MTNSAMWLMNFKASKVVAAATLGVPFSLTVGPVVGTAVAAALGVMCVAGFWAATQRKTLDGQVSIPPV